jgi:hypothetical protein
MTTGRLKIMNLFSSIKQKKNKGYTLLFAVIVATVILSVTAFITSISRKQFVLTAIGRDSMLAVYAADSGIQCALKLVTDPNYSTTSQIANVCNSASGHGGDTVNFTASDEVPNGYGYVNKVSRADPFILKMDSTCALISIYYGYDADGGHLLTIESRGYNLYDSKGFSADTCPKASPRTLERGIKATYLE